MKTIHLVLACGLLGGPACAQSSIDGGPERMLPVSKTPANTSEANTRMPFAPPLPTPTVGEDSTPTRYLQNARAAIATGRTGEAQEALERAQTRALDRGVDMRRTEEPSSNPLVLDISRARAALGAGDKQAALREIDAALALVR